MRAAARTTLDRSPVARYVQLATLFRNRIAAGEWVEGSRLPTLENLIAEFGVARATLRQALGELEAEGLITRERARGTFVARRPNVPQWCVLQTDWVGMLQSRQGARIELLGRDDGIDLPDMSLPIGTNAGAYTRLKRRHWLKREPFLLTSVFVEHSLAARIPPKLLTTQTAIRMVAELPDVALTNAHQVITAAAADMEVAELLRVPLSAPVMRLDRFATDGANRLLVCSLGIYRADVARIDIALRHGI